MICCQVVFLKKNTPILSFEILYSKKEGYVTTIYSYKVYCLKGYEDKKTTLKDSVNGSVLH